MPEPPSGASRNLGLSTLAFAPCFSAWGLMAPPAHAVTACLMFAVWPFSRLVHARSIPVSYFARSWIPFRSRDPRTALAVQRGRAARAAEAQGARRVP